METTPNDDNVVYFDEYPELAKRVWLRRLDEQRKKKVGETALTQIIPLPERPDPDGAA